MAAALVSDGKVLAVRRTSPPELAGRWEFPGGKVEAGETEPQALRRELREELSVEVRVLELLGRVPLNGRELALYLCRLPVGDPRIGVGHDRLRWLSAGELPSVNWLDADLLFLDAVARELEP